jgi:hypothetical protein
MKNVLTVLTDNTSYGKAALAHAQKLSGIFDADINTVLLTEKKNLQTLLSDVNADNSLLFVMPVATQKKNSTFNLRSARKWIPKSRVPVLAVGNKEPENDDYQQVVLPLDLNCREKELALWASYFPTYFQKNCPNIPKENHLIHIIYNQYKDELLKNKVQNNIDYVVKLFDNLYVPYQIHPFSKVDNIHTYGLKFAKEMKNSVLLYLIPEHYSLIDMIFGTVVNKLLDNTDNIPVLCLNARDDLLVLCQ